MTTTNGGRAGHGTTEAARAALDVMLTDATPTGRSRFVSPGAAVSVAAGLARRPDRAARRAAGLGRELTRVARGSSELRPGRRDRRFADPAWETSWLFRRLLQSHLAVGDAVDGLISDAGLDWHREREARFIAGNVVDALAPSNFPWSNPAVIKETVDQGGPNLVRGARRFAGDFPRLPSTVDTSEFAVGENLALTPGSVVLRTEVFELIQYAPQTREVREVPLLFAPPTINKFYVLDLAPGRSMVEWLVRQGQQVFVISWRNPDAEQGHFDLDTYAAAVLEARDAVAAITGQPAVHINGACSGGIIAASALGHLAAEGRTGGVASLTLMVAALDNERAGTAAALTGRDIGRGRRRRVGPPRLPRRPGARRRVHLAATQRPGLELRGQQLPPGQGAAGVRRPVLEPGHGPPRRRAAPRLHPHRPRQHARRARRARGAGHPRRPRRGRRRQLRRRRPDRPHHPVGERLPQHPAARRRRRASSSRPAATSRRSSTRPPPEAARATASPTSTRADAEAWAGAGRRRCPAAGGPTTTSGSPRAPATLKPAPKRLGGARLQGARQGSRQLRPRG